MSSGLMAQSRDADDGCVGRGCHHLSVVLRRRRAGRNRAMESRGRWGRNGLGDRVERQPCAGGQPRLKLQHAVDSSSASAPPRVAATLSTLPLGGARLCGFALSEVLCNEEHVQLQGCCSAFLSLSHYRLRSSFTRKTLTQPHAFMMTQRLYGREPSHSTPATRGCPRCDIGLDGRVSRSRQHRPGTLVVLLVSGGLGRVLFSSAD